MFKSWARNDQAFFAAGACHILADLFVQLHADEDFRMIYLKPHKDFPGSHVYASNGVWAFDHNGWTKESELLKSTQKAYVQKYPGWGYTKHTIEPAIDALENFCKANYHRLPWQFAHLPWDRAYKYIKQFEQSPPNS